MRINDYSPSCLLIDWHWMSDAEWGIMRNFYTNDGLTLVTIPDYWWVSPPPPPALAPDPAQTGFVDVRNNSDVWPIHHSTINPIIYGENYLFLFDFLGAYYASHNYSWRNYNALLLTSWRMKEKGFSFDNAR